MKMMSALLFLSIGYLSTRAQDARTVIQTKGTKLAVPEGIAVDGRTGLIYVTSIWQNKILAIKADGSHRDFISSGYAGFAQGLGIKVDERRGWVWAVSNTQDGSKYVSRLHAFNIKTGLPELQAELVDTSNHFFNDFILDEKGNAYITATMGGELFFFEAGTRKLALFLKDTLIEYPNGIEYRNGRLYIATYSHGPVVCDIGTRQLRQLEGYTNKNYAYNLDGFGFSGNSLFAVHNSDSTNAENGVVEYVLNAKGDRIVNEKILAKGHPLFHEPTTLAISGKKLYLLANSNLGVYNANKESVNGIEDKLTDIAVLVFQLK